MKVIKTFVLTLVVVLGVGAFYLYGKDLLKGSDGIIEKSTDQIKEKISEGTDDVKKKAIQGMNISAVIKKIFSCRNLSEGCLKPLIRRRISLLRLLLPDRT